MKISVPCFHSTCMCNNNHISLITIQKRETIFTKQQASYNASSYKIKYKLNQFECF